MHEAFRLLPQDWTRLRALLEEALALPPAGRGAWLARLDAGRDGALRPQLASLLAHADATGDATVARLLDTLPAVETGDFATPPVAAAGETIGPWHLLRELGSGGMASVWLAERTDMLQRRQVALKLPLGAWKRAGLAERLAREREILAALEHPNIARLYDAGVAADGQPWLALEYVEGERLDAFARRHALDLPARVRLLLQVARAVAHAHQQLVVHRDLKPDNILVGAGGVAKLLDFGIAKLLDAGQASETDLTQRAGRALTPRYAAPEQILGRPVGTTADVYSLGVVLFELLAERHPYLTARETRAALEEAVLAGQVARPSAVAPPERRRALRGDLDSIVLKAMKAEPRERYPSADALAEDLQRWLDGRPVLAQPDTLGYRARRFVGRHRLAVGVGSGVAAALLGALALVLWQAQVAIEERRRAEEVKNFIASVFRRADPYGGGIATTTAADLLKDASRRIDEIAPQRVATRVELLTLLGDTLLLMQDTDGGEPVVRRAVDESMRALGPEHPLTLQARLLHLQLHRWRGRAAEMRAELDALLPALRRAGTPKDLAVGLQYQAHAALDEGRFDEAEAAAAEGLALARRSLGETHHSTVQLAMMVAQTYQYGAPRPELALRAAQEAMALVEQVRAGQMPHPQATDMRHILGRAYQGAGQALRAVAELERAAAEAVQQVGPTGRKLAFIRSNLARAQRRAGLLEASLRNTDDALALFSSQFAPGSTQPALALASRGATRLAMRDADAAAHDLDQAAGWLAKAQGERHANTVTARLQQGQALALAGDAAAALALLATLEDPALAPHLRAALLHARGVAQRLAGDPLAAAATQEAALALRESGPAAAIDRAHARTEIALAQLELGQPAAALALADQVLADYAALQGEPTPAHADAQLARGRALLALGRTAESKPALEAAAAYWREARPASPWAAEAGRWLAAAAKS